MAEEDNKDAKDEGFAKDLAAAWEAEEAAEDPKKPEDGAEDDKKDTTTDGDKVDKKESKKDDKEPEDAKDKSDKKGTESGKDDEGKPTEGAEQDKGAKKEGEEEEPVAPQPLTKDDVTSVIRDLRNEERSSTQNIETATNEVLEAYYPDGLSNVLVDQNSGKELRTPQDVVDASGGDMSTEEAAQWLMNEQYKLDQNIKQITSDARQIAETTVKFKQDGIDVLQRYEPLFKQYPTLQDKVWNQYKKLIKSDDKKGVILSAPDMRDFYDTVLEPYRLAYEYSQKQSGTQPTAAEIAAGKDKEEVVTPGAEDRLDEGGDGGAGGDSDDPNDFAQQVKKELAKGL